ncbi:MAG TPA: SPOR domain-containing protein [Prolixibacteraceae bacterium]|nr:SPOR domain-containing protein [Prolixibacteraceae bacterium]
MFENETRLPLYSEKGEKVTCPAINIIYYFYTSKGSAMSDGLKIVVGILALIFFVSCRQKESGDYIYYQPYKRDTVGTGQGTGQSPDSTRQTAASPIRERVVAKPVSLNDKYFIVVSSYTIPEYAHAAKEELKEQGFSPEVFMQNNDGWYKLAVESCMTLPEADSALNRIRRYGGIFSDARIVAK